MIQEKNNVCKEVLTILSCCDNDFIEQIPSKVFKELIDLASDSEEEYYLNPNLELENQEISEEAKDLLALIYFNYLANMDEKKEILEKWNENEKIYQLELSKKYNLNNIFKKQEVENKNYETTNTQLVKYKKEGFLSKIIKNIKKFFNK